MPPHRSDFQTSQDLSDPSSFSYLCQSLAIKDLSLHPNRRMKTGWHVKIHRLTGKRELHFPALLEKAPDSIKRSLLLWATLPGKEKPSSGFRYREKKKQYERLIRSYLDENTSIKRQTRFSRPIYSTAGKVYDLSEVFDFVNRNHFNSSLSARLRWGGTSSKTSFQRTHQDPDGVVWHSITIAGIYNHPDVPRFAIEAIMYHEMLHIHVPPVIRNGRRIVHGSSFKNLEKAFPAFDAWREWEHTVLPRLAGERSRKRKKRIWGF